MSSRSPCPELEKKVKHLEKQILAFKTNDHALKACQDQFQALLNATADSAFLLDTKGTILFMNDTAAQRLGKMAETVIGENIYHFLSPHVAEKRKTKMAEVIRSGEPVRFQDEREGLIFDHTVYPILDDHGKVVKVAIYAKEVTRRERAEAGLRDRERALKTREEELQEVNAALRVVLKTIRQGKTELQEEVLANVQKLVMPYVHRLKNGGLTAQQKAYLDRMEANLEKVVSPFVHSLSSNAEHFTPREIQVAKLVRDGKTAKEIAELLCLSVRTVESYKKGIRRKLHLNNSKINLRSHLLSV